MSLLNFKRIHFIGIGGIGVSALARLCRLMGQAVSGSDMRESVVTKALEGLGVPVHIGHNEANVTEGTDLVIHTEDVNEKSAGGVELAAARERGIRTMKYSQALGQLVEGFYGVGVTGTNGKSTTTAILGLIMEQAGTDPMVVLGSRLAPGNESENFRANARFGKGRYFIFEADEYHRHMLDSRPHAAIITNIEADHLDYYRDLADVKSAFVQYVDNLPAGGLLVYNSDDPETESVAQSSGRCRKVSFGLRGQPDYLGHDVKIENQKQIFSVRAGDRDLGRFQLAIPGDYNIMNALGALAMGLELGLDPEAARSALAAFSGIWRRFETVGTYQGKPVISDYAHHPTGISGLLTAAQEFYPGKRILLVFQPHQKNRTRTLFNEFVAALSAADNPILPEIYSVPGREKNEDQGVSSQDIVQALAQNGKRSQYAPDLDAAEQLISQRASGADVILLAGAGSIDQLARKLAAN